MGDEWGWSALKPPDKLSVSAWSTRHMVLSADYAASTGRFHAFPYQTGIMDAMTDPRNKSVVVMKSARVGYSQCLNNALAYYLHHEPSPILLVQPRNSDAEDHSKRWIAPMIRDVEVLSKIAGDPKSKTSAQTILTKQFSNGSSLKLIGADSPGGFRRITARIVLFDEVDGYPTGGAGSEGDQIALGTKRAETFWNRVIVVGSTPTIKGLSRIEKEWLTTDQRRFHVPCPHCGGMQVLEWGGPDTPYGIKWEKDETGKGLPESVYYVCKENGCIIQDTDKPEMVRQGQWIATAPFNGHAGFHIWAGYSLFPNASWQNLVAEWLRVKDDPLLRQTFINLVLGEPFEDRGEKALNENKLVARCEVWPAKVPYGIGVITIGVDTQDYRFECETVGWGANEESWSIDHEVIEGDMETPDPWNRLDAYLKKIWRRADGRGFEAMAVCVDSGGHHTQKVYDFCKARLGRRVWAIKGESAIGGKRSPVWPTKKPSSRTKATFRPIILGVNAAKDSIRSRLHIEKHGPGYMHFPVDRDINYFAQLTSERSVRKYSGGQYYRVWELPSGRANEALDCRVYAYAALCGLLHFGLKLNRRVESAAALNTVEVEQIANVEPASQPQIPSSQPIKKKSLISRLA